MNEQLLIAVVLIITLGLFIWGRWRYDLVALLALLSLCILGIIPADEAFSGFGHPAVVTVAAVLVISRSLINAGIVQTLAHRIGTLSENLVVHICLLTILVTLLSGFMNNIGALALLMPVAIKLARDSGHSPSAILMPIAFGSLLGGMLTLIGTPPNIIIASYREQTASAPFGMFDFFPVGALVAAAGVLFIILIGWRLIPNARASRHANRCLKLRITSLKSGLVKMPKPSDKNSVNLKTSRIVTSPSSHWCEMNAVSISLHNMKPYVKAIP
jgi:di/tricarboxylate transporter